MADLKDDASALSIPAMNRWNSILRVFTAEYLGLTPAASLSLKRDPDEAEIGGLEKGVANGHAPDDLVSISVYHMSSLITALVGVEG